MHDEAQDIDSRYYGATFLRGWQSFAQGSESNITYTTDSTCPVGTEVLSVSTYVWARGPRIRLDKTQNYEVEFWIKRQTANTSGDIYMVVSNYDSSGNIISGDGSDWNYPLSSQNQSGLTTGTWYKYKYIVGPYGGQKDHSSSARYISLGFILNYTSGTDVMYITGFKIRPISQYNNNNLTLYNDGSVGIGTTSPSYKLDVNGTFRSNAFWTDGTGVSYWGSGITPTAYGGLTWDTGFAQVFATSGNALRLGANGANAHMYINTSGDVGINDTSPSYKLDVTGDINFTSTLKFGGVSVIDNTSTDVYANIRVIRSLSTLNDGMYINYNSTGTTAAHIRFFANGTTERMRIDASNGNVGIGTTSPSGRLTVAESVNSGTANVLYLSNPSQTGTTAAALNFINADSTIKSSIIAAVFGNDYMTFNVGSNTERMRINASGNVGINTTSPQKPLEVITSASDFASVGVNTLSVGQWTGIHFGYREANTSYRKSAIVFERTDTTEGNAQGKVHILNGPQSGATSATLSDAKLTIDSYGRVGIGTTSPGYLVDIAGDTRVNGGGVIVRSGSPTVYFQDTDHRSAMAHVNSNIFYILRGDGTDSTNWAQYNGYWPLQINLENNNAQFGGEIRTFAGEIVTNLNFVQYNASYIRTTRDSVYLNSRIGGRITNANPQFINGTVAGWSVYNNSGGSTLTHSIVSEGTINYIPNATGKALKIAYNGGGSTSPGFGGFYFATTNPSSNGAVNTDNQYRQGQRMMVRIMANIPSGRTIEWASNGYGDNSFQSWITSQAGTGDWEEYIMIQQIGKGGTISSTHFFYIAGGSDVAFDWYVAYAESVDLDAPTDIKNSSGLSVGYDTSYNSVTAGYGGIGVSGDIIVNGEVGIGTNTPGYKLHVVGNTYVSGYIQAGGTGYFGGDVIAYYSDKRLKKDIEFIDSALYKISKIGGYYYTPNELALQLNADTSSKRRMGVIAQEVQEVFPEAIEKAPFDMGHNMESISGEDYLTVKYERLIPVLIEAIKEQQKQIEELKYLLTNK
jgi:hypothetical protein